MASGKRNAWITTFLSVTALALGGELYAAFDTSPNTTPWTDLLATYVPEPVTLAATGILCLWLPWHFWSAYRAKRASQAATRAATRYVPRVIDPEPHLFPAAPTAATAPVEPAANQPTVIDSDGH